MKTSAFLILFWICASIQSAIAGPVGVYSVEGENPGGDGTYTGEVIVEKNGATYTVAWKVGDTEFIGTGIGAANVKGTILFGEAAENDTAITVSYSTGDSFGLALFIEQENGEWRGIWAYGGSDSIGTETWTRQ